MSSNYLPGLGSHPNPAHAPLLTLECADHIPADSQDGLARDPHGHLACKRKNDCVCVCHAPGVHMYAVQVQRVQRTSSGWFVSVGLPTFYLHPDVQGIVSAQHAESIVRAIMPDDTDACRHHYSVMLVTIDPHSDTRERTQTLKPSGRSPAFG